MGEYARTRHPICLVWRRRGRHEAEMRLHIASVLADDRSADRDANGLLNLDNVSTFVNSYTTGRP